MSDVIQSVALGDYQSKVPEEAPDRQIASKSRQEWITKLFAVGDLRSDEERGRLEKVLDEWDAQPIPTWEEAQAMIDRATTFDQLIEEIERDAEKEP